MDEYLKSLSEVERGKLYFQMVLGMIQCLDVDSDISVGRREEAMAEFENGIHLLREQWKGC